MSKAYTHENMAAQARAARAENAPKIAVEMERKAKEGSPALYLVRRGEVLIGLLEKYPNTRTDTHPWKAYSGWGHRAKFLGAFYANEGGKAAAIRAITEVA